MAKTRKTKEKVQRKPGVCIPWQEKVKELPPIQSNPSWCRNLGGQRRRGLRLHLALRAVVLTVAIGG